ncbi:TonB-dependent receptor [Bowmanella denitrificans]|uniref:TonB-dependent receptor n=1 Tax=Bowmanella denitrificans TaxID=366582 RepID=A0ABN0XCZ4_9ALTE
MQKQKLYTAVLTSLFTTLPSSALLAQQGTGMESLEKIQVTGSRIKRTDMEGPSPVQSIDRVDIERTGFQNLQQLLERLPVNGAGTFSTRNNSQDSTANGAAAVSLRGLGPDATLVLINGRRVGVSAFAEGVTNSFVDINSIPVSAIQRIDILKDGASAIYGSDAVAGVVNIILKQDIDGLEIEASYGQTKGGDYDEKHVSMVWGTGEGKSRASVIFDYFNNSELSNADMGRFGTADQTPYGGMDFRSSRGFPGYFYVNGVKTVDPACPPEQLNVENQNCYYDYGPASITIPKAERLGAIFMLNHEFGNDIEAFVEVAVQHNTSNAGGAATPLDESAGLTVPASHPNNPFGQDIDIGRFRPVDGGNRRWDIESDTLRMLAGLKGEFNQWLWEASVQKGRSESQQTGNQHQGWVRVDYLQREINAGRYNPFGGTYNDADVIADITTSLVRLGKSRITAADLSISGDLFEFEQNRVMMAAGLEYRKEQVSDIPDEQFQQGLIFGTEAVSAAAKRSQWAAYLEFSVPFGDALELQAAGRYDDYSDFGSTFNPKLAMRYLISDDITLRASWAQGFRAPSLAQVGLGPSEISVFFKDTYRCLAMGLDPDTECDVLDYNVEFRGNPDLKAEESESWNIGIFYAKDTGFDAGFDLWSITQENKIEVFHEDVYQAQCNQQNSPLCERNPPQAGESLGVLSKVHGNLRNVSSQDVAGIDLSANYRLDMQDWGEVKFGLQWTAMHKFERGGRDYLGEYEYPKHRWVGTTDWRQGDVGVSLIFSYIGEFEDTPDVNFDGNLDFDQHQSRMVDSHLLTDLQLTWQASQPLRLTLGVNNLFDKEPPFAIGNGDDDLFGYVSTVHNPRGRHLYAKAAYRF